jgi:hypothetical protein
MNEIILTDVIDSSNIRREWHDGEWFYCAIDYVAELRSTSRKDAQNYYHVLKQRFTKYGEDRLHIEQLKTTAADGKAYFTDFTNANGIHVLETLIEPRVKKRDKRVEIRQDDEVANFHPKDIAYLKATGWQTEHHLRLNSGSIIDIVAYSATQTYVIECKPELATAKLYTAIGQVLCYRQEYNLHATPAIASFKENIVDYARWTCTELGIELIEISND